MLKFAIVGAGAIASVQAEDLLALNDLCEIVAVYDRHIEKAQALVKNLKLQAQCFSDYEMMLSKVDIDCVTICLSPALHCEYTCKALRKHIHVICEKPMAMSLEQCDLMIDTAKDYDCKLAVICQNRYKIAHMRLKELVNRQALGKVNQVTVNSLWWRGNSYYDIFWRGTWESEGGGCLLSHGTHHLDLLLWLFGSPKSISAFMCNLDHKNSECEDYVTAILRYANGMIANLTVSIVNHGEEQEIVVQGQRAKLSVPFAISANYALENGFPAADEKTKEELTCLYNSLPVCDLEGHRAQLRHFIKAVNGEEVLETTGECGRDVIEVIMGIYKSAVEKREISLPINKDDAFYSHQSRARLMPHFHEKTVSIQSFKTQKITLGRDVGK